MSYIGPLPRLRIYTTFDQYRRVLADFARGRVRQGDSVRQCEESVSKFVNAKYAIAMPLARVGIYFAVKALIKPGQKVILSPYTIADVVNMVVCAGGNPVFADIERKTGNIDAAEVERLIDADTGAVLVTHFYGLACDIERIAALCKACGVPLIEDAAQAFGVRVNGQAVGTFGNAGIYSFGVYKNVNSFLGGMFVTNDAALKERLSTEILALPYQSPHVYLKKVIEGMQTDVVTFPILFRLAFFWLFRFAFLHNVDAINNRMKIDVNPELKKEMPRDYLCRMTPLQARMIVSQLDRVDRDTQRRIETAKIYHQGLSDIPEIILPPLRTDLSHMYWYFPIQYDERHDLVAYAMKHMRDITESYHRNCADMPCFAPWYRDCPNARATANALIYLPTYPRYTRQEVEKTVQVIRRFFGR